MTAYSADEAIERAEAAICMEHLACQEQRRLVAEAVLLLEYALHLRTYGERAPGGDETWREFDQRCETWLRARPIKTPTTAGQGSPSSEVACVTPAPAVVGTYPETEYGLEHAHGYLDTLSSPLAEDALREAECCSCGDDSERKCTALQRTVLMGPWLPVLEADSGDTA